MLCPEAALMPSSEFEAMATKCADEWLLLGQWLLGHWLLERWLWNDMVPWPGTYLKAVKLRRGRVAQVANPGLHQCAKCVAGGSPEPHSQMAA